MNQEKRFNINSDDEAFDKVLKKSVQGHSYIHWSPIEVIKAAVDWLGNEGTSTDGKPSTNRILDIGSGVGKFCLIGAMNSNAHFTGIEIRKNLIDEAVKLKSDLKLKNVDFIHSDIKEIDFSLFTSFYFYNPFCELMALSGSIDDQIKFDEEAYYDYQDFIAEQLKRTPKGTKLVTYCSPDLDISMDFDLKDMYFDGQLQLWERR